MNAPLKNDLFLQVYPIPCTKKGEISLLVTADTPPKKRLQYTFRHDKLKVTTLRIRFRQVCTMKEILETLVYEVFVREERCRAELRLTAAEADCLRTDFSAHCQPLAEQDDKAGKRWYLVQL